MPLIQFKVRKTEACPEEDLTETVKFEEISSATLVKLLLPPVSNESIFNETFTPKVIKLNLACMVAKCRFKTMFFEENTKVEKANMRIRQQLSIPDSCTFDICYNVVLKDKDSANPGKMLLICLKDGKTLSEYNLQNGTRVFCRWNCNISPAVVTTERPVDVIPHKIGREDWFGKDWDEGFTL